MSKAAKLPEKRKQSDFSPEEWDLRLDLALIFRLSALEQWDDQLTTHISARAPDNPDHLLMHPPYTWFEEVTASCFHRLDQDCQQVAKIDEDPHKFAFPFHQGVYNTYPEAQCVVHLHTKAATAVAMQEQGLVYGSQYSMFVGEIGYHDYEGLIPTPEESKRIAEDFNGNQVCMLRSHGFILWGASIMEAYVITHTLDRACQTQIAASASAVKPYRPSQKVIDLAFEQAPLITRDSSWYNQELWRALHRKMERIAPEYTT